MNRISLWLPVATMLLVSLISYIDRNTLALLAPTILKETRLSAEQYGYIISAFSFAYTIANPLWGRWLDVMGVRWGMSAAVLIWTAASTAHAFVGGFLGFGAARAALGFGEGATFPGGLRTAVQTLPPDKRSRGIAVAYSGGSLGAVITPLIITPIAHWWGWRAAFLFTGFIGLSWLALWQAISRNPALRGRPERLPAASKATRPRFSDPRIWSFMCAYAWGALPLALVIYGAAIFLNRSLGTSQLTIGKVLWIPPLGWEIGYFVWGWLADRRVAAGLPPDRAFGSVLAVATLLSLPLMAVPWLASLPGVMALLFLSMFAASGFIILPVAWAARVYSPDHAGLIAGLGAGAWSLMVAVVMPVFGRLFDLARFDAGFVLAAGFPVAGYVTWRTINRGRRLQGEEDRSVRQPTA
ncbi:MAG: MFS transporter [Bryobacterales bacterium]|nr:MFS transporter [Bryobacterales bacterium]